MPDSKKVGPHPSYVEIRKEFITEAKIQEFLSSARVSAAREDAARLQGVAWIDNVRKALRLPLKTFGTAAVSYHKFRLAHAEVDYNYNEAAAASLFIACKIEDTLKRSREILCAAYNLRVSPAEQVAQDDPIFENSSKVAIGMERLVLEAIGFDFRSRFPQKLIAKMCKFYGLPRNTIYRTAIDISIDMYRTFAPLKMTTIVMAVACIELSCLLHAQPFPSASPVGADSKQEAYANNLMRLAKRPYVMETLQDLLDLYAQNHAATILGQRFTIENFISVRLGLNQESNALSFPRYCSPDLWAPNNNGDDPDDSKKKWGSDSPELPRAPPTGPKAQQSNKSTPKTPKTPQTPDEMNGDATRGGPGRAKAGMKEGTLRYMLDVERAEGEQTVVDTFFRDDFEDIEVEEEIRVDNRRR
ncbi:RNA polymerase II C-terminal domain kinase beta subunit [Thelotrema lepadinum]|nr:RNA polymerase II C-terminal domain kinase beta subunit [Thelotrema lepadinum]